MTDGIGVDIVEICRFKKIKYKGYNIKGNLIQKIVSGLLARVIQHECDHLNGIVFTHRLVDKKAYGYEDEIEEYWKKQEEKFNETKKN